MLDIPRYQAPLSATLAEGWTLRRLTLPSRLYGANGMRTGPDGRIYVAQVSGSQISAIDVATGAIEAISPLGGDIIAPDDIAFDEAGNLYATEITEGRVSMREPNGRTRVVLGDLQVANPITFHQGRILTGEFRPGGRILELDRGGGAPRVIADNLPMPNAFEVGPDGKLYFPVLGVNEIWRVGLDGGTPERVAGDLGGPSAVKFDAGGHIVSVQVTSGQVLRIDPRNGNRSVLAEIASGLDNLTFVGERLFVSNISGLVSEVLPGGRHSPLIPGGFNWPLGLGMGEDGVLYAADGPLLFALRPGETPRVVANLFVPGSPGYMRGVAVSGEGEVLLTTANGEVVRYRVAGQESEVLASGFDQLYGVAAAPGGAVFAEQGAGRVHVVSGGNVEMLAEGLDRPTGVAMAPDGSCYASEAGAGRIVRIAGGRKETLLDGLFRPHGILVSAGRLYIVDAESKELIEHDLESGLHRAIATGLPVGAPPGVVPKVLGPIGHLCGPMGPFADIAAGPDGALYISADTEGSVLELRAAG